MSQKINSRENVERNLAIYVQYRMGIPQAEIAHLYGLTTGRVNKIIRNQRLKYEKHRPKQGDDNDAGR
jgi:DNA-directed RNA polymerase specialized sigma24 family protein